MNAHIKCLFVCLFKKGLFVDIKLEGELGGEVYMVKAILDRGPEARPEM